MDEFQALAMRLAANVLLPGTGWVAFPQFMDRVGLMMDLLGKRHLARGSLAFFDFHTITADCDATISFRGRRPAFSNTDFEDTLSLRAVFVMVRATDLIDRFIFCIYIFDRQAQQLNSSTGVAVSFKVWCFINLLLC